MNEYTDWEVDDIIIRPPEEICCSLVTAIIECFGNEVRPSLPMMGPAVRIQYLSQLEGCKDPLEYSAFIQLRHRVRCFCFGFEKGWKASCDNQNCVLST